MSVESARLKVLKGIGRARGGVHRYTTWRWSIAIGFTAAIAALPLFDVLRFDLWGGHHVILGRERSFVEAAKAFAFPFLAINVAIVLASRFLGRWLCGFACPYGAVARLAEWFSIRQGASSGAWKRRASLAIIAVVLASITFSFWVDWRVFAEGSPTAVVLSAGALGGTAIVIYATASRLGLRFCRDVCPSGVYFALLGRESFSGVELAHPSNCTDCGVCDRVCPMDLEPRRLIESADHHDRGLYPDGLSSLALCIRCGDCVAACEGTNRRRECATPLELGFLSRATLRRQSDLADGADEDPSGVVHSTSSGARS